MLTLYHDHISGPGTGAEYKSINSHTGIGIYSNRQFSKFFLTAASEYLSK